MQYLSREDIEILSEKVIRRYKGMCVPKKCLCYNVNIRELASLLGYHIEFHHLSNEGTILGRTTSGPMYIEIYDELGQGKWYYMDGSAILVEKSLLLGPYNASRINFTIAHELAHQIINRTYPEFAGVRNRMVYDYCRGAETCRTAKSWYEWQADALAAALLMPMDAVQDGMFMFGLGEKMKVLSRRYSPDKFRQFCDLAEYMQVSRTALAYRMEQLGLLERNLLIKEAKARRGVA